MKQVRIGIIGMGSMGCGYADMILKGKAPALKLAAVTRIKEEKRQWARETLPKDVPVFQTAEELFAYGGQTTTDADLEKEIDEPETAGANADIRRNLDAVLIATPHYDHPLLAAGAFRRGLHVLCDKPAGVYTMQVKEMLTEFAKHDLVFAIMFNQRTNPIYRELRKLVQSGAYGALKRVNWIITDWYRTESYYRSSPWRATWEKEGGGVLINQCPHNLDLLQWICGMPARVHAFCHEGKWHAIQVEDDVTAYLEFPNGATGVFVTSTGETPGTNRLEINLDNAQLLCENGSLMIYETEENEPAYRKTSLTHSEKPKGAWRRIQTDKYYPKHAGILQNFGEAILYGEPLIAKGEEGLNSLKISNAMYLSSWQKRTVEIPFDDKEFYKELKNRINSAALSIS